MFLPENSGEFVGLALDPASAVVVMMSEQTLPVREHVIRQGRRPGDHRNLKR